MLNECSNTNQIKIQCRDDDDGVNLDANNRASFSLDSSSGIESTGSSQATANHYFSSEVNQTSSIENHYLLQHNNNNINNNNNNTNQFLNHQHHSTTSDDQYFTSDETNSSNHNLEVVTQTISLNNQQLKTEPGDNGQRQSGLESSRSLAGAPVSTMVPTTAHCLGQQMIHYSLTNSSKSLTAPSPVANMALNFSHDLLQHHSSATAAANHHNQSVLHHHNNDTNNGGGGSGGNGCAANDHKPSQLELDSATGLTAAGMSMWKNTMNGFLPPATDINSPFSSWTTPSAANLNHQQSANMTQHILEQNHLIAAAGGYQHQHNQRSLQHLTNQDLSQTLKNHTSSVEQQASFMLNSINQHQQAAVAAAAGPLVSDHHHHQHHTPHTSANDTSNSHHRNNNNNHNHNNSNNSHHHHQSLDHHSSASSYNLSMSNDVGHFYSNRSQGATGGNKSAASLLLQDRSGAAMSLGGHHQASQLYGHSVDHLNPQPTTSHHVSGLHHSGSSTSKNIGTYRCPHCSEIFNARNQYQSHLKTHSQEKGSKAKFHCELCGHAFSQKTSLNRHMKSHTGERPFPCEVCGKAFSEKERLKIHMRTHTGEKPFSCGICGKSFSQKSTVKRHQTVHTGEKKFKCDCGKGFANRGNLIAHIKTRGSNHFE